MNMNVSIYLCIWEFAQIRIIINNNPYIIHHTSYIIHHTSYIIHHTSYIIHHISYIIHHTSYTEAAYSVNSNVNYNTAIQSKTNISHKPVLHPLFVQDFTHHTSHIHTSHITHHTSHITHHTSHITHHTSTHHTSHITHTHQPQTGVETTICARLHLLSIKSNTSRTLPLERALRHLHHTSYIIHHTSYIIHHTSYIIHHTSYIIHHTSYIIHHTSYIIHHRERDR